MAFTAKTFEGLCVEILDGNAVWHSESGIQTYGLSSDSEPIHTRGYITIVYRLYNTDTISRRKNRTDKQREIVRKAKYWRYCLVCDILCVESTL